MARALLQAVVVLAPQQLEVRGMLLGLRAGMAAAQVTEIAAMAVDGVPAGDAVVRLPAGSASQPILHGGRRSCD